MNRKNRGNLSNLISSLVSLYIPYAGTNRKMGLPQVTGYLFKNEVTSGTEVNRKSGENSDLHQVLQLKKG